MFLFSYFYLVNVMMGVFAGARICREFVVSNPVKLYGLPYSYSHLA